MNILPHLKDTPNANERFKYYYNVLNNYRYKTPINQFLKASFSYQMGVFLNYLVEENIELTINTKGYIISVLDNTLNPNTDVEFLYEVVHNDHYIIDAQPVPHDAYIKHNTEKYEKVMMAAIVKSFQILHGLNAGYSSRFNNKFINHKNT